jgi:hypothetical protein
MDRGLQAKDLITVGNTVELEALDTPGHTMSHVCLLSHTEIPALFCGDTLFNAGAGNCHHGGHPEELYGTFAGQLAQRQDNTLVYPGHDYMANNLEFTLDREPDNARASELLGDVRDQNPNAALVFSLAMEKEINTFFRLQNPTVIARLHRTKETSWRSFYLAASPHCSHSPAMNLCAGMGKNVPYKTLRDRLLGRQWLLAFVSSPATTAGLSHVALPDR